MQRLKSKTIKILLKNQTFRDVKASILDQDILPQYTFLVHKSIDLEGYYVVTNENTGAMAYFSKDQRKKVIEEFFGDLENNKLLYIQAIEKMKVKSSIEVFEQKSLF